MDVLQKKTSWITNARPTSLVQSAMPAVLAVALAVGQEGFCWWLALIAVLGVLAAHLGMNLADDYFDYKVDMLGDRDRVVRQGFRAMTVKYPYLADGSQTLRTTLCAILGFGAVAMAMGAVIVVCRGCIPSMAATGGVWPLLLIVVLTLVLGIFYSAPPLKLGYRGLGELVIGVIFGPLLMIGVYYSATGTLRPDVVMVSIPVGLLVTSILFTHSFIDKKGDEASNKMTLARLIGTDSGNLVASFLFNFLPFVMVLVAIVTGMMHPAYLAVLLVLPRAVWLWHSLVLFSRGEDDRIRRQLQQPPRWLGPLTQWEDIRKAGLCWFMARWLTARNLLSGYCLIIILVHIVLLLF